MQTVLSRNPLNFRARAAFAQIMRELAVLDPTRSQQAIAEHAMLVALQPGYWQPRLQQS